MNWIWIGAAAWVLVAIPVALLIGRYVGVSERPSSPITSGETFFIERLPERVETADIPPKPGTRHNGRPRPLVHSRNAAPLRGRSAPPQREEQ
jgi:hypothetical protein